MDTLTTRGRAIRVAATLLTSAALLAGTIWGDDDEFPFGPFRMYATNEGPDAPAADPRVEGVDRAGRVILLNERNSGIKRAEIEGQRQRYVDDPAQLRTIAQAYANANPGSPALVEVRIVVRWHGIRDSRPTRTHTDQTLVTWRAP